MKNFVQVYKIIFKKVITFKTPRKTKWMDIKKEPNLSEYCDDYWKWDKRDKSHRGFLRRNKLVTEPILEFTVGVIGTRILNKGRYYWELNVDLFWGSYYGKIMMGIGTKNCPLNNLRTLRRNDTDHKCWLLSDLGTLWQNGNKKPYKSHFLQKTFNTVGIFFDGINGTLSFYENGKYLGVAFTDLHLVKEDLYPIFVTSRSSLEMSLKLTKRECLDLQDRCKVTILKNINDESDIKKLQLPKIMKQFLNGVEYRKRMREKHIIERRKFWREKFRRKRI